MTVTRSIPWLRIFVEGVVIVGSILLAFGIDAWWDGVQERRVERELLITLRGELQEAGRGLESQLEIYEYLEPATRAVADALAENGPGPVTVADTLLAAVILDMSYDPPTGTATALLASGQVGVLRSLELRATLAGWPAAIQDGVEEQLSSWRLGDEHLEPLLQGAVPNLGPAYRVMNLWQHERRIVRGSSQDETVVNATPELWNAVYQQLTMIRNARMDLVNVTQRHLLRLEALVAEEID